MSNKVKMPKIVRGGIAVPLGNNFYYMRGRKHEQGGIDVGANPKTGLEVEDGEVMQLTNKNIKVFSSVPFLNGKSPAQKVLNGENPNNVFNAQEKYKDRKGLNDDGTKKKRYGGDDYKTKLTPNEEIEFIKWYNQIAKHKNLNPNPDAIGQDYDYRGFWKNEDRDGMLNNNPNIHFTDKYKQPTHPTFSNESIYSTDKTPGGEWIIDKNNWLFKHNNFTSRQAAKTHNYLYNTGEGYILGNDTIIPQRKRNGGIYMVQANGKTRLRMFPSTGELPKARLGAKGTIIDDYYKDYITNKTNTNPTMPDKDTYKRTLNEDKNNNFLKFVVDNLPTISNIGGSIINTIGAIGVNRINKKALDKMNYNVPLLYNTPNKLKTTININPQLDKMRETLANYERAIDRNTASSKVALARKQQARLNTIEGYNQLYSDKENKETDLINRDRLNQQEVAYRNTEAARKWYENKNLFDNTIIEKRAENDVDLINSVNSIIQNSLTGINKAYSDRQNRLALLAAYPNVNPRILRDLGISGITERDIQNWDKVHNKKQINR